MSEAAASEQHAEQENGGQSFTTAPDANDSSAPLTAATTTTTTTSTTTTSRRRINRHLLKTKMATSLDDLRSLAMWKGAVAEFVGVLLLVLVGCGSCVSLGIGHSPSVVQIALCFGLSVATIVWNIAHISGGHINPAVTLALLATSRVSLAKAIFFVLFQLLGGVVGAGLLMGLTPESSRTTLGITQLSRNVEAGQGLGVELFITFVLVFTVFASLDTGRQDLNGSIPLTIGLAVTMCHLFAVPYTGASMNTARSFGPALVTGTWDYHWVYWVGPIVGGVAAGLLYEYFFAIDASLDKVRNCMQCSNDEAGKKAPQEDPEAPAESLPLTDTAEKPAVEEVKAAEMV